MPRLREWARRVPSPSVNLSAVHCFERMKEALLGRSAAPVVLVVGGGIMGKGMRTLAGVPAIPPHQHRPVARVRGGDSAHATTCHSRTARSMPW